MNSKLLLLITLFSTFFISNLLMAQSGWSWADGFGSKDDEYPEDMITDAGGNIYVSGTMTDSCIFTNDTLYGSTGGSFLNGQFFIAKYDSSGNRLWAMGPDEGHGYSKVYNICADESGAIYGAGYQFDSITIQGVNYPANGYRSFVFKVSPQGQLKIMRHIDNHFGRKKITNDNGTLWLSGYSSYTITVGSVTITVPINETDLFSLSMDTSLTAIKGFRYSFPGPQYFNNAIVRNGELVLAGHSFNTLIFNKDTVTAQSSNPKSFILKSDTAGNIRWLKSCYTRLVQDWDTKLEFDGSGSIFYYDVYLDTLYIGTERVDPIAPRSLLLLKFKPDGKLSFYKRVGGNLYNELGGIALNTNGNIIISGLSGRSDLIVGSDTLFGGRSGLNHPFIAKLDPNGTPLSLIQTTSSSIGSFSDVKWLANSIVGWGYFRGSIAFGTTAFSTMNSYSDYFVARTGPDTCPEFKPKISLVQSCGQDSAIITTDLIAYDLRWSNGDTLDSISVYEEGYYNVIATDSAGCSAVSDWFVINLANPIKLNYSGTLEICKDDTVWITTNVQGPVHWSTGEYADSIQVDSAQWVYAFDSLPACQKFSDSLQISYYPLANPQLVYTNMGAYCPNDSFRVSTTLPFSHYDWSVGSNDDSIWVNTTNAVYAIVTNMYGCEEISDTLIPIAYPPIVGAQLIYTGTGEFCTGDSIKVNTVGTFSQYDWFDNSHADSVWVKNGNAVYARVTDVNGCMATTDTLMPVVYPLPNPSIVQNDTTICTGDSVQLTLSQMYASYLWSEGSNSASSIWVKQTKQYTVEVTDNNNCKSTSAPFTLTVKPDPVITLSHTGRQTACLGDTFKLFAGGAQQYIWNMTDTVDTLGISQNGYYQALGIDAIGCMAYSDSVELFFSNPVATITNQGPLAFCHGDSVELTGTMDMDHYLWSTTETTQSIWVFDSIHVKLTVTDSIGCMSESTIDVTVYPLPPVPLINVSGSILSTAATGKLQWYRNGMPVSGATDGELTVTENNTYVVSVEDQNGCISFSEEIVVNWVGIHKQPERYVQLYPNPFTDEMNINWGKNAEFSIYVYNVNGKELKSFHCQNCQQMTVNLSSLSNGTYLVRLMIDDFTEHQVIIK